MEERHEAVEEEHPDERVADEAFDDPPEEEVGRDAEGEEDRREEAAVPEGVPVGRAEAVPDLPGVAAGQDGDGQVRPPPRGLGAPLR
jgi:hypothetical protein